jgi:hypothetical protein
MQSSRSYFDSDAVDDWDAALAALPLPPSSLPTSSSSQPSSSPLLLSLPTSTTSPTTLSSTVFSPSPLASDDITADSEHHFTSKESLRDWVFGYARRRGFRINIHSSSTGGKYSGYYACESEQKPSLQRPSISRHGAGSRIDCECLWRVNFSVVRATKPGQKDDYHLTKKRSLLHTGHSPALLDSAALPHFTSLLDVSATIRSFIVVMLQCNFTGEPRVKRYVETLHKCTFDGQTFHNLFNQCKETAQVAHPSEDFQVLFQWLLGEMAGQPGAFARLCLDGEVTNELNGVLYMSADMVHNLTRNGTILVMDTTFKVNRFNWPLLIVCGMNEHHHTVLFAVALLRYQTTAMFTWALQQMREACGAEAWGRVSSVATDGDKAMAAAISDVLPSTRHLRCWYHLEQNMRQHFVNLGPLTSDDFQLFHDKWQSAASLEDELEFEAAKNALHAAYPAVVRYLTEQIWPQGDAFLRCRTKSTTTLGVLSTQRVESFNATLKIHFAVNSHTPLTSLFEILRYAAAKSDRDTIAKMQRQDLEAAQHPPTGGFTDTVRAELSRWAADKVVEQVDFIHVYEHEPAVLGYPIKVWKSTAARRRVREVYVNQAIMRCTCGFPTTYLLPCRHVLYLNKIIHKKPFLLEQVGKRWLRSFMPSSNYAPNPLLRHVTQTPSPSPLVSVRLPSKELSQQQRWAACQRFGEDLGRVAAPHKQLWSEVETRCAAFIRSIESLVSVNGATRPPPPDPSHFTVGPLHATVPVECIAPPLLPKSLAGRKSNKRNRSGGEAQPDRDSVVNLTQ